MAPTALRRVSALLLLAALLVGCRSSGPASPASSIPVTPGGTGGVNARAQQNAPTVVLVSFDGFRYDYLDRYAAPNLQRVVRRGVRAEGLIPSFPSKTFPNHYAIATGLRPERSGLVANNFYDPARGATYALSNREAVGDGSWYNGEPIWVAAERQGLVAASYFWVGSEAAIGGVRPTFWKVYDGRVPNTARVDSVLTWLRLPAARRPHVVTLYMSDVDDAGHRAGPDSPDVAAAIARVDSALGRLVDGLDALPQARSVTLVLVSDHGMQAITPEQTELVEDLIDTTGVRLADAGPNANLHVRGGPARARAVRDTLNARLQHGRAYLRADVPEALHYRADPRIGDVVVVMEAPWQITLRSRRPRTPGGTHGWDPIATQAMHGLFLAMGPGIRAGATIPAFANVEVYPFLAETLGLHAAPSDGRAGWLKAQLTGR